MEYRKFGNTDLIISEVGFGAWGIGGPAMAGDIPIGWGNVDDETSADALIKSYDLGVNFYDTADFYGLGHSEELIGKVLGNKKDVIIATKVGHRLAEDKTIKLDYSKNHIIKACEESLKRLRRDVIDYYQLHSARLNHFEQEECINAMEKLKKDGKVRYWGLSLNTFHPGPEAEYLINNKLADGFQLVFNIINQRAENIMKKAGQNGYGIIARMPLQFGLLTGKFNRSTTFSENDHRAFRLTPDILEKSLSALEDIWPVSERLRISKTALSMSFILSYPEVSTVIPGIKTPAQAELNIMDIIKLGQDDMELIRKVYRDKLTEIVDLMEKQG